MLLKIKCEYCGNEKLEKTNCDTMFYCSNCDDEISIHECDIDIIKEGMNIDSENEYSKLAEMLGGEVITLDTNNVIYFNPYSQNNDIKLTEEEVTKVNIETKENL